MEWILDLMYRCTLTQEPRGSLASLRIISILLTIINCGGTQTFNILHSTSPGNKLKALQILSAVLVEVIPQNIESDETFCLLYTPKQFLIICFLYIQIWIVSLQHPQLQHSQTIAASIVPLTFRLDACSKLVQFSRIYCLQHYGLHMLYHYCARK